MDFETATTYSPLVIDLAAGSSGTVTAAVTSWSGANFSAFLEDGTTVYADDMGGNYNEVNLSYSTDVAQTLTLVIDGGSGGNGGYAFVAMTGPAPTPEPGTLVLLATGLFGLLAYAWRKRK